MSSSPISSRSQVVVVTGASAGVGRAVVCKLAREGARIGLIARGMQGLEATRREVESLGGRAIVISCDVADADAVERAADRVERELGPIDVWINNAMTTVFAPVKATRAEEYKRVMEVIYLGYVHGTLTALRRMLPRDRGSIVQVGSALAYRSIPLQSAYCAAKHAVQGFTESLRTELLHDKSAVTVSEVHLPAMNTPQFRWSLSRMPRKAQPVPPIYEPEVAAAAIVHAAHHPRRTIMVAPSTVKAIFANKVAPGFADHYLAARGFDAQMTDAPRDPDQPSNLFAPVEGDRGAHGPFDARARKHSLQVWANLNRGWLSGAVLAVTAAAIVLRRLARLAR